jgi:hypothetical protein
MLRLEEAKREEIMNWTELLKGEMESAYGASEKLLAKVNDQMLNWKPSTGSNWMTTGQLMMHLSSACGATSKGFATGDWGMPHDASPGGMLPPAETMSTVKSVAECRELLKADKKVAFETLAKCSEADLAGKPAPAPWDPTPMNLGLRLLQMTEHLKMHKGQLFYYLKLQGLPVNTMDLWGA